MSTNPGITLQHCYLAFNLVAAPDSNENSAAGQSVDLAFQQQEFERVKDRFNQAMQAKLATKDEVTNESIGKIMHTKMF